MRIAYFGYDFFVDTLEALLAENHQLIHVQTHKLNGIFLNKNDRLLAIAERLNVPVGWGKPCVADMERLREADLVLVMGFKYPVPSVDGLRVVNLHPSLLPEGRGPFPIPWLILHHPEYSGLTLHEVTSSLDAGPILCSVPVTVCKGERLDTLCAKMRLAAPAFVCIALQNLDELWGKAALPEGSGSYWKATEKDWTLSWEDGWERAVRTVRAFGEFESVAKIENETWLVTDASGWTEKHTYVPGTLIHHLPKALVVAANDGFVLLRNPVRESIK